MGRLAHLGLYAVFARHVERRRARLGCQSALYKLQNSRKKGKEKNVNHRVAGRNKAERYTVFGDQCVPLLVILWLSVAFSVDPRLISHLLQVFRRLRLVHKTRVIICGHVRVVVKVERLRGGGGTER